MASNALHRVDIHGVYGRLNRLLCMAALSIGPACACPADRLLTVVVPYAAGGSVDVTTRIVAKAVGRELGRPVNVSNVPGASGMLAVKKVLAAERDGCTLLSATANAVILVPLLNPHADFTSEDLRPVGKVGSTDLVLVASARSGLRDMQALRMLAQAGSTQLRAGHPGQESLQAVALRQLRRKLQISLIEVPYSGAAQLVNDLVGGHLDIAVLAKPVALPLVQRGSLNLLTTLTADEGFVVGSWSGWFAARGVIDSALENTARALKAASRDRSTRLALMELGVTVDTSTDLQAFTREVGSSLRRFREVLAALQAVDAAAGSRSKND